MKPPADRLDNSLPHHRRNIGKGVYDPMGNEKNALEMTDAPRTGTKQKDAPALVKKIGKTTYIVRVHFSETMSDKIKRMLKNEMRKM